MYRFLKIIFLISFFLILTACGQDNELSLVTTRPTDIITASSSPSVTPTSTATQSPTETITPYPTSTNTTTVTPTKTPIPTVTPLSERGKIVTLKGDVISGQTGNIAFSSDGELVALADNHSIHMWNVNTHQLIAKWEIPYPYSTTFDAGFSPDNQYFAITKYSNYWDSEQPGHVLIWDVKSGDLLRDWPQSNAKMVDEQQHQYSIPVYGFKFFSDSNQVAFPTGNSVEVREVTSGETVGVFQLGDEVFASYITLNEEAEHMYVGMSWQKENGDTVFRLQQWDLESYSFNREIDSSGCLIEHYLCYVDFEQDTMLLVDLETDEQFQRPFRQGYSRFSDDLNLMAVDRSFVDDVPGKIEIWDTDAWENIYTFQTRQSLQSGVDFAFSPDNSILAISTIGYLLLWNIQE